MTVITNTVTIPHWIGGGPDTTEAERYGAVTESATGEVTARVPLDTADAVDRAAAAAEDWGHSSISRRTQILFAFRALVDAHRRDLAEIITLGN